jgi:nucleotidyltransferase/DNA polymerase involved in DNA repair
MSSVPRTIIAIQAPRTADFTPLLPYLERLGALELRLPSVVYIDAGRHVQGDRLRKKLVVLRSAMQAMLGVSIRIGAASSKAVSLIAARSSLPGGVTIVHPGNESTFLNPIVIELLPGIGRRTATYLRNRGIRTIGQFRKLPQHAAVRLFGTSGIVLHEYSGGSDPRQLIPSSTTYTPISGRQSLFSLFRPTLSQGVSG